MYRLGVDLGGTNIAVGVVDENYNIIGRAKRKTNAPRSAESVCDDIADAVKEAVDESGLSLDDIASFGIGTPGAIDTKGGIIKSAGNLQFFDVNLKGLLKERLGKDFTVENDGNAAAYGEYIAGAGKGTENFIAITLGTGVGGGISGEGDALIKPVANYFSDVKSSKTVGKTTKILVEQLGNDAGIIGAAFIGV